ncbi:MAG: anthranilate synthase component I family protein [Pirellulales bacterium]
MSDLSFPLVREVTPAPDAEAALLRFANLPYCLFLDSAMRDSKLGRYSFLMAAPFETVQVQRGNAYTLAGLECKLKQFASPAVAGLPPFQGGAAGLFSYDFCRALEKIPANRFDEFRLPDLLLGFYDVVLAFDHVEHRAWLISQGFPETEPERRAKLAEERLQYFWDVLHGHEKGADAAWRSVPAPLEKSNLAPQFEVGIEGITSNFSYEQYKTAIERTIEYICAGDVFQVNLAQRLLCEAREESLSLYLRLRQCNPAPFAGYLDGGDFQIVSASPERFIQIRDKVVEARPIKGTRRRTNLAEADLFAGDELLESEKDRAENVMIVDLLRNDISRVCDADSVRVTKLCGLETYQFVQHLVSVVQGKLSAGKSSVDLMGHAFPGGSITGAPKVRAMEIIAELEPTARGPYCGSLGYLGFDGSLDLSILIRTITANAGWWQFPVGGGITVQSNPAHEYEETWHKAEGLLRAILPR